jgi:hypothetical protein
MLVYKFMSVWLFAESEFNREVDEKNNFQYFPIQKKKLIRKKILSDDFLVTYITKIMKITDIRQIINNEPQILPKNVKYDRDFECYLETKLIKKKNKSEWIDRAQLFPQLEIFFNKVPNLVLLDAPVKLNENDSKKIFIFFNS